MVRKPESAEARASREASSWLIQLQEEPDDLELRRRFKRWLEAGPTNADAWAGVQHLSEVASTMQPELAERWRPLLAKERAAKDGPAGGRLVARAGAGWSRRRWALGGAAVAIAACFAFLAVPPFMLQLESDYVTGTAEQRTLELPDGSEVTLAAGSAIAISYSPGERRVHLLAGEAFFQVMPNPHRPFRVAARTVETSVLGTRFGVRLDTRGATVSVETGTVEVAASGERREPAEKLGAGQSIRLSPEGQVSRTSVPPQLVAAWRHGQLYLHDQTLRDAVDQLRRYYAGTIVLADETLAERRVTGAYNLKDPEDALLGMARAHGARVRRITPWLIVLSSS
jgi:transmembrane sensor